MPFNSDEDNSLYPELPPRPENRRDEGAQMPPRRQSGSGWQTPPVQRRSVPDDIPEDWGEDPLYPGPPARTERPVRSAPVQRRARVWDDEAGNDRPAGGGPQPCARPGKGRKICVLLILICIALLAVCGFRLYRAVRAHDLHRETVAAVYRKTLPENVYVDDIPVGGLTVAQAAEKLRDSGAPETVKVSVTVKLPGGERRTFTEKQVPITRNTAAVLNEAAAGDWTGIADGRSAGRPPLEYRHERNGAIAENGAYYYTRVTYSRKDVYSVVDTVSARVDRETEDAEVIFDPDSRCFVFTDEVIGNRLDTEDLYEKLVSMLDNGIYTGEVEAVVYQQYPAVTRAELESTGWGMISTYTTYAWDDANRNTNILLACRAVNGKKIMPGGVFSFNDTTGQRTEEKGYKPAAAIAGGATVDEVGGGVCQVSSTLFNVCAMADLEIVERSPHTWPSTYVEKGRDATVNWPNLDFKFRNTTSRPLYILARFENRACTVELYGLMPEDGVSIDLETVLISETPPPEEPAYELNTGLPHGAQNVKKKARTGYEVQTWKVYKYNGYEFERVWLCDSSYKMIQQVIEYND